MKQSRLSGGPSVFPQVITLTGLACLGISLKGRFERLSNLGNSLSLRFGHMGDVADIDEAITAQQQTVSLVPDGHPGTPTYLNNLGESFRTRFHHLGDIDLDQAITSQQRAVRLTPDGHLSITLGNASEVGSSAWATLLILTKPSRLSKDRSPHHRWSPFQTYVPH